MPRGWDADETDARRARRRTLTLTLTVRPGKAGQEGVSKRSVHEILLVVLRVQTPPGQSVASRPVAILAPRHREVAGDA
jgi:hypothetical protein